MAVGTPDPLIPSVTITEVTPVDLSVRPPLFSVLTGFLLVPSITSAPDPTLFLRAVLDDTTFRLNRFSGLTVAILCAADSGVIRLQDNTVTDCFGGAWFDSLGLTDLGGANELVRLLSQAAFAQPVVTDVARDLQLAMSYPAPQQLEGGSRSPRGVSALQKFRFARRAESAKGRRLLSLLPSAAHSGELLNLLRSAPDVSLAPRFHITNNQIDAQPGDGTPSGFGLLIFASSGQAAAGVDSSVLVNSNEVRASWPFAAAFIIGANSNTVTGNLILNQHVPTEAGKLPFSLVIFPPPPSKSEGPRTPPTTTVTAAPELPAAGPVAVTGNVLKGRSNLAEFQRSDIVLFDVSTVPQLASLKPQLDQLNSWKFLNFEPLAPPSGP
jgi:hypothetical protein